MAHENTGLTAEPDFSNMSLAALCDHIVRRHHEFTRAENARIAALLEKVCGVHGDNHGELLEIEAIFTILRNELEEHMLKEERMLFPYISLMESSLDFRVPVPAAPFGTTRNPVAVMMREQRRRCGITGRDPKIEQSISPYPKMDARHTESCTRRLTA
jgi:regulator of cell morphogenesis and NO signaling